jgi:hypothetical protein
VCVEIEGAGRCVIGKAFALVAEAAGRVRREQAKIALSNAGFGLGLTGASSTAHAAPEAAGLAEPRRLLTEVG